MEPQAQRAQRAPQAVGDIGTYGTKGATPGERQGETEGRRYDEGTKWSGRHRDMREKVDNSPGSLTQLRINRAAIQTGRRAKKRWDQNTVRNLMTYACCPTTWKEHLPCGRSCPECGCQGLKSGTYFYKGLSVCETEIRCAPQCFVILRGHPCIESVPRGQPLASQNKRASCVDFSTQGRTPH